MGWDVSRLLRRSQLKTVHLSKFSLFPHLHLLTLSARPSSCITTYTECPNLYNRHLLSSNSWGAQASNALSLRVLTDTFLQVCGLSWRLWLGSPAPTPQGFHRKQWPFKSSLLLPVPVMIFFSQTHPSLFLVPYYLFSRMNAFFLFPVSGLFYSQYVFFSTPSLQSAALHR